MNYLKPLFISASLFAISFSSFAYNDNNYCDGAWHKNGYHNQQQYNDRPCDNNRHYNGSGRHYGRHNGAMQYSTSIQTTQPDETLKKLQLMRQREKVVNNTLFESPLLKFQTIIPSTAITN